jgi:hypothetical protein
MNKAKNSVSRLARNGGANQRRPSFGSRMVAGLTELRDALRAGERLEDRFTVRTVALTLKPRQYNARAIRRLRKSFGTSQAVFAQILGVTAAPDCKSFNGTTRKAWLVLSVERY